ncbi:hypothetical protein AA23498_3576 [Acetobacter nitrogenifigens DSM 23921 = NBRC 105050]|uniref:Uncharacterized protein n=1 Tax=Acetobacter nitrogenifigens DSM 23921 = NBRC 105050 TaxID=1120919 RepID=A0A511XE83_9PROT|nr:hypothetical protein [Acetobacter nitrogenifigens]GBQ99867.1 hypothetical protein AA23498_3576 [Acetobacter nitrogenifigens DSM 23921 = NBRC 105050]GEN61195.1 hypothetical protein ANI02nite_30790 [Acetobacter nitrogenifigens DSM 23921 = NBRC 105050]
MTNDLPEATVRQALRRAQRISCAAIKMEHHGASAIFSVPQPGRHHDVIRAFGKELFAIRERGGEETQGFMTTTGRFVDRAIGAGVAERARQRLRVTGPSELLFSEDMW